MIKSSLFLSITIILLFGYNNISADTTQAPNKQTTVRYGLEHIKLGSPAEPSIKYINLLIKSKLSCNDKKIALGKVKRNFTLKTCKLPKKHSKIMLWDEALQKLTVSFLDNKLFALSVTVKTSGDYEALYNKHGKHILKLFGTPSIIDLDYISWQKQNDKVILEDKKNGIAKLQILNKTLHDYLYLRKKTYK